MILGREALEDHSQLPKKANKCSVVAAFRMYGGIGMSESSLHRESTNSLILAIHFKRTTYVHSTKLSVFVIYNFLSTYVNITRHFIGRAKRAHLVVHVQLARIFYNYYTCIVHVARYRIASKCFYAFLFRRPRGEKYRNTVLPLAHNAEAFI